MKKAKVAIRENKMSAPKQNSKKSGRRSFLKGAAVGSVAAAASTFPAPAISQGRVQWRMLTTWPKNFPGLGTGANRLVKSVKEMSDGRFDIKVFAAGEFVPPFESFEIGRAHV